jgi:hypothetical protein
MTAHAEISADGAASVLPRALDIQDTGWGFVVTERTGLLSSELVTEAALKFLAVTLLFAACAQWLLPGSLFAGEVLLMKLALTGTLCGVALVLFRFADRGFLPELQVDAVLREIRLAARNAHGASRLVNRIPMRDIEEFFVQPCADQPEATELLFRVTGLAEPVRIAAGTVADLAPVLQRLARDLRSPRERVALRMAG